MTDKFGIVVYNGSNDITIGVSKSYVRANYIESDMEEDIDMKQQYKIKDLLDPINDFDAVNKKYVDESTLLIIPTYEPLTNDYVSLKNLESGKIIELATTKYVKDNISIINYNKTNYNIDSIDGGNHDFISTTITLPMKQYMNKS